MKKWLKVYNVSLQRTFVPGAVEESDRGEVCAAALARQLALGVDGVEEVAAAIADAMVVGERGHGRGARRPARFNNTVAETDKALVNTHVGRGVVAVGAGEGDAGGVEAPLHARVHHWAVVELAAEGEAFVVRAREEKETPKSLSLRGRCREYLEMAMCGTFKGCLFRLCYVDGIYMSVWDGLCDGKASYARERVHAVSNSIEKMLNMLSRGSFKSGRSSEL